MEISYLAEYPSYTSQLTQPAVDFWKSIIPDDTVEKRLVKLRSHLNTDSLPIAWVAHENGVVLGTAALRKNDLDGREDLSPWLGGVFVLPQYRGRGVAYKLCQVVERAAWAKGYTKLFLFTLDQ